MSYKHETLIKLDQHVNGMMTTAGKKFKIFCMVPFSYNHAKRSHGHQLET